MYDSTRFRDTYTPRRRRLNVNLHVSTPTPGVRMAGHVSAADAVPPTCRRRARLDVDDHFLMYVSVADDLAELLEGDPAVLVAVREQDRLVDDLLQLSVLQVVAHHHLQNL